MRGRGGLEESGATPAACILDNENPPHAVMKRVRKSQDNDEHQTMGWFARIGIVGRVPASASHQVARGSCPAEHARVPHGYKIATVT